MKNTQTTAMYIGIGAILALILLFLMGRIRTEPYDEATEQEMLDLMDEIDSETTEMDEIDSETTEMDEIDSETAEMEEYMGPSTMVDSEEEADYMMSA
jgi:uncharacterized membrane-anchored protein YhcB (DUF1043 family)